MTPPADSQPPVPDDNTTMLEVLESYQRAGYRGDFSVDDDGLVLCHNCRTRTDPCNIDRVSLRRLEGASDPSDMMAVVALTCPSCRTDGTLVLNYGPEASAQQAHVLRTLGERRSDATLPDAQTPDEADASSL
jgi:hypothetical protein